VVGAATAARTVVGSRNAEPVSRFEPRYPLTAATAILSLWIILLSLPMLTGNFIAAPYNDQYFTGYAFRHWAAVQWKALGHFPLWNPEIYAGLPFVGGMHGDLFYPTAWLRLLLPTHVAMNLGFFVHYILAGVFTYWFLRLVRCSWAGAVLGGVAYQLTGVIGSYVSPGHDGKLFVSTMLPLGFAALTLAIRDRRWEGYSLFAVSVGLALLSPHPQMAQYFLLAAAIYALYLTVSADHTEVRWTRRFVPLAWALAAVVVGVGISAIQYIPFYEYIPYSPRDESVLHDFAWSARYAIPWDHVPELFLSRFSGESFNGTYWGSNGLKLHSEYLGLPVVLLAALGVTDPGRRKLVWWMGGIAVLFLLVALGSGTPFYRVWWEVVPFVKSTRAPGMALYVVAFMFASLAAFGIDQLANGRGGRFIVPWLSIGGAVCLLGMLGVVGAVAESAAQSVQSTLGLPALQSVQRGLDTIRWGAVANGVAVLVAGGVAWAGLNRRVSPAVWCVGLIAVVGTDLWWNARAFWNYSRAQDELFAPDELKSYLIQQPRPFRVWDANVYPQSSLMSDGIAQWYGHHGNELHSFDVLNGRQELSLSFENAGNPQLIDLFAIRYIILRAEGAPDSLPGYRKVLGPTRTSAGVNAFLFESVGEAGYARLVPSGYAVGFDTTVATVLNPRFPIDRVVLLDPSTGYQPSPLPSPLPEPMATSVEFEQWAPGRMRLAIRGGVPTDSYLMVSENYYPAWAARVDGRDAPVLVGDGTLLTVPVPAGTSEVELTYESSAFRVGKIVTWASVFFVVLGAFVPGIVRRAWRA
jgi:hypothetical protein